MKRKPKPQKGRAVYAVSFTPMKRKAKVPPRVPTFTDAGVAAVRDPAVRALADQLRGKIADLEPRLAALENVQREMWDRFHEVQYRKGSRFAANAATGAVLVRASKMGGDAG